MLSRPSSSLKSQWAEYIEWKEAKAHNAIPLPPLRGKWPGNFDMLLDLVKSLDEEYAVQYLNDQAAKHGNLYKLRFLGEDLVITLNPNHMKQIMATDFPIWVKGRKFDFPTRSVLGTGVFNSDGDMWKFHRSMTRPFFSRERISDFEIFGRHSAHAIEKIKERCATGAPINMQDLAGRFTMDSATEFLFGLSVNSMDSPLPLPKSNMSEADRDNENTFVRSFVTALHRCAIRFYAGDNWPLWEITGDKTVKPMKAIYDYLDPIVQKALDKKSEKKAEDEKGEEKEEFGTLLEHLVAATDDRIVIRDELLNILIAGRDTTAHGITAIMYFLATQDKKIVETLRAEILEVVGPRATPTFDQIKEMKYLRAVIHETLRLMPSVPANLRQSTKGSVWTDDDGTRYYIPKGVAASWSTIGMHRRTDLWGPSALEFDPDRWIDERNKKYYLANPFIFLPFHGGPRICLGQQFALNEASFFTIRLLQAFDDISFAEDGFPDGTLPPAEWKNGTGRKPYEKVVPKVHLTMYFMVPQRNAGTIGHARKMNDRSSPNATP
ncbi:hypothetical protein FRB99_007207 [Tulasnella sp. 403]|nr:hypothetical protein FRB99_007207 [Tulasnella sp. 403]